MRTVVLRIAALAVLLLLVLASVLAIQTMRRLPDMVVYFVSNADGLQRLEAVGRRSGASGSEQRAAAAVAELAAGPSRGERSRGLSSAVPSDTRVLGMRMERGILYVDLSSDFAAGGGSTAMQARLHQLFYTLTQPREVAGVVLLLEGAQVDVFGGEGIMVSSPWLRAEHPEAPLW